MRQEVIGRIGVRLTGMYLNLSKETDFFEAAREPLVVRESGSVRKGFVGAVGDTPLIHLETLSEETGCEILGKAEFLNPGGSVKDRAALWMVRQAEIEGTLKPGGTVVEGTAGNTGIGLAHLCKARGYACLIYMPNNQSPEKVELLRTLGAEVILVPPAPYKNEMNYQKQAGRHAARLDNAVWVNQFDNLANAQAHFESTGPEIWQQTDGTLDAFVCAAGTGGTIAGTGRYLKAQNATVQIVLSDCMGSALHAWVKTGEPVMSQGPSVTEGIGNSRVTDNLAAARIDDAVQVTDTDMLHMVKRMLVREGWFFGSSTGINLCGAVQAARLMGPGHRIVTILCDSGGRYQSSLWNPEWLAAKGLG